MKKITVIFLLLATVLSAQTDTRIYDIIDAVSEERIKADVKKLAEHELTGGQIELVIKNTAYKIAISEEPIFKVEDFEEQITKEKKGQFDSENKVGFF